MTGVFVFVPKHQKDATKNLQQFIHSCRYDLILFEPDFDWDNSVWAGQAGVAFYNIDQGLAAKNSNNLFKKPFIEFAKAYFRYRHTHRPNQHNAEIRALKCVERALLNATGAASIVDVDERVLDMAVQVAREHYKVPYPVGREIASLAKFLNDHRLAAKPLDWKNPIRRPISNVKTGSAAKEDRAKKLPNQEALDALADIFSQSPSDDQDIFVTSTAAILLCSPSRIGEVIDLEIDCEVEERKRDGSIAYGWRFRPKKGGPPMIKWIPDVMVEIAKEAIARIRRISQPARELASWLEGVGPMPINLQALLDADHGTLSLKATRPFIGKTSPGVIPSKRIGHDLVVEVQQLILSAKEIALREHPHFPWIDATSTVKWSRLLYCFNANQLSSSLSTLPLRLFRPSNSTLNNRLGDITKAGGSIFARWGIVGSDGNPLRVTSHQFRHLLTTIANRGGLSTNEIARWRGSLDAKQNRAYDQRSEYELAAMIRANDPALIRSSSELEIAENIRMALPVTTEEFNTLEKPTAHITEIGFCVHDFVMSPCQRFRDCLNCTEQVCVKGDRRLAGLRDKLAMVEKQVALAEEGAAEGLYGADPWTHIQRQSRDRLRGLIAIMEDPSVPDGSVIRLANSHEFSATKRALRQKGLIPSPIGRISGRSRKNLR